MKVKLEKMVLAVEPLQRLFEEPMPIRTTFRLKKVMQELESNLKIYDESRTTLLKKYGDVQEDTSYKIKPDKQEVLEKEHKDLLDSEVSFGFQPLSSEDIGDIKITPRDLLLLDWLIIE